MLIPQSGQEKLWLKFTGSPSATSTIISPSERAITFSIESVSRFSIPCLTTRRSTTISILCFIFLSSLISSESSYILPSTWTLTYPLFLAFSKTLACSPFLPRTTGDKSCIFVLSGIESIWSTISSIVCLRISLPHFGQCGMPILAYSRRK